MRTRVMLTRWILRTWVVVALGGGPALAAGVAAPGTLEFKLGYGAERPLDLAVRPPDVSADTAQALQEDEARRKVDALGREYPRRPDLDHDVTQGIQSRGLERALGP